MTDALAKAKQKVQPGVDKLKAAKAEQGYKNRDKLQQVMEPFMDEVKTLRPTVDDAKEAIEKLEKKRQKFKEASISASVTVFNRCLMWKAESNRWRQMQPRWRVLQTQRQMLTNVTVVARMLGANWSSCATKSSQA